MSMPPLLFFAYLSQGETVYWEACENYQKRSLRNRYYIMGANEIQVMSIPLEGGKNNKCPIGEVRISYKEPWQDLHLKSIHAAYGKSAFFHFYIEELTKIFESAGEYLWTFNWQCLQFFLQKLQLTDIPYTTEFYEPDFKGNDYRKVKISDFCVETEHLYTSLRRNELLPKTKPLSILDLLFCLGPESQIILREIKIDL